MQNTTCTDMYDTRECQFADAIKRHDFSLRLTANDILTRVCLSTLTIASTIIHVTKNKTWELQNTRIIEGEYWIIYPPDFQFRDFN